MTKRLLDVGSCGPDHASLRQLVQDHFDVVVDQADGMDDALELLGQQSYDLVTVNRVMDRDGSEGLEIIRAIKSHARFGDTPVMMITNFADHQHLAVTAGAVDGFGKSQLVTPSTVERLRPFLA